MTSADWPRVKQIAAGALDLPHEDRAAFVSAACADDAVLYTEVSTLLEAAAAADRLYETPLLAVPASAAAFERAMQTTVVNTDTRVGAYRIVRELGQGGMGSVYLAARADGEFDQQVAIKFVGGRMAPGMLVERFRQERQILAVLDHPNIARLLDGGTTADGFPYVVMEYVAGVPIDEFCDSHALTTRARVQLFRSVCAAVHYAHQRLIVHRDLKATNILVTADGTPKLLDFGIATLVEPGLAADARAQTVMRALTPEAASPEQIKGEPITVASDVYALGVLFYRLLTGRSPYAGDLASDVALMRAICDDPPIAPRVDRDLDLILLKALRKEPTRRYGSAAELSDDLGRYLDGRAVDAAPDSRVYRLEKFLRRHWAATTAAAVTLIAILAAAGVALYQARLASAAQARAERRFEDVRRLANSFLFEFHDAIADLPGALSARQLVVKRAAEYLDALAAEAQDNVALQREVASAYQRLGTILGGGGVANLGDVKGAEARYMAALGLREALGRRPGATAEDIEALASLHVDLSRIYALTADMERSEQHAANAVTLLESPEARTAGISEALLAVACQQLGYVQGTRGETQQALASLEKAMGHIRRVVQNRPNDATELARLVRIAPDYSNQLVNVGRAREALDVLIDARQQLEALLARDPLNKRYRQNLSLLFNHEGLAYEAMGDTKSMIDAFTMGAVEAERLRAEEPRDQGAQYAVMWSHCYLGGVLVGANHEPEAVRRLRECIADGEQMLAVASTGFVMQEVAQAKLRLGKILTHRPGATAEGCRLMRTGLDIWAKLAARSSDLALSEGGQKYWEAALAPCR